MPKHLEAKTKTGKAGKGDVPNKDDAVNRVYDYIDVVRNYLEKLELNSIDNQGVHINSGIPNRAFYLVASDIGTHVAMRIWYDALKNLWPNAGFNDAVEVITHSARILVKENLVPEGSPQSVHLAFKEVGLPY